jgi:catechol 2,3-dioxygenase-like lactoylglutathione lyase family enzyme
MSVQVNALDHLVINVTDVARSAEWYRRILGMEVKVFDPGQGKPTRTSLMFGNQKINVRPRNADKVEWFTADHEMAGSDDLCFLTTASPQEVVAHLGACGVAIEEGPVAKQGARGTLRSVYCRDPDGSLIEISSYEDGMAAG